MPGKDIESAGKNLAQRFNGTKGMFDAPCEDIGSSPGVTENAAIFIKLLKDTACIYLKVKMMGSDFVKDPCTALDYLILALSGQRVEKFLAVYLDSGNKVVAVETLHEGTINQTMVYPRKAIEKAFKHNAGAIVFVHNHPSGDSTPSDADRQLAKVLDRAAASVNLTVRDHLIIGRNRHFSARQNGWITRPVGPHRRTSP